MAGGLAAGTAHAEWLPSWGQDRTADGAYLSIKGGMSDVDDHSYNTGIGPASTKLKNGYIPSGAVGVRRGVMRYEIEGLHQESDVRNHSIGGAQTANPDGSTATSAAMANVYVDLGTHLGLKPYIGGGAGYAHVKYKDYRGNGVGFLDDSDDVFAYQGIAGVAYDINPCWTATAEYRYLGTNDPEVTTAGGTSTKVSNDSNNVLVGLRYKF
jgi:opacity protein-like surface antigen